MGPEATELAQEQAYFDNAARIRARKLADLSDLADAGAHAAAAAHLKKYGQAASEALGRAGAAVAFGRTDDADGETVYIGRHLIRDDTYEVLVVSWQSPVAAAYYEANYAQPHGLRRKRTFDCDGNTIQDFTDVVFDNTDTGADDFLFRELSRGRTGTMRDIVATIQSAQYEVIRSPFEQVLVIEGGPGTGKTAVALHRVAWLLFHHRDKVAAADVLVVGPHPTFVRYVATVLAVSTSSVSASRCRWRCRVNGNGNGIWARPGSPTRTRTGSQNTSPARSALLLRSPRGRGCWSG